MIQAASFLRGGIFKIHRMDVTFNGAIMDGFIDFHDIGYVHYDNICIDPLYAAHLGLDNLLKAAPKEEWESIREHYRLSMEYLRLFILLKMGLFEDDKWQSDAKALNEIVIKHGGFRLFVSSETV